MPDFDNLKPDVFQTNPATLGSGMQLHPNPHYVAPGSAYPAHVHKWAGADQINEYKVVRNDDERDAALAAGWSAKPLSKAPVVEDADDAIEADAPRRGRGRPKADA